jgi:hypothetical protein
VIYVSALNVWLITTMSQLRKLDIHSQPNSQVKDAKLTMYLANKSPGHVQSAGMTMRMYELHDWVLFFTHSQLSHVIICLIDTGTFARVKHVARLEKRGRTVDRDPSCNRLYNKR